MNNPEPPRPHRQPSLKDFLVHYDLAAMQEEARLDYSNTVSGGPRHMEQKDIAARFRDLRLPPKSSHEPS